MKKVYMIKIFLTKCKLFWLNENIFWYHEEKGDIMKLCFIKYKIILIKWKYIFISYEFLFLQYFRNHNRLQHYSDWIAENQKQVQNFSDFSQ